MGNGGGVGKAAPRQEANACSARQGLEFAASGGACRVARGERHGGVARGAALRDHCRRRHGAGRPVEGGAHMDRAQDCLEEGRDRLAQSGIADDKRGRCERRERGDGGHLRESATGGEATWCEEERPWYGVVFGDEDRPGGDAKRVP